MYGSALVVRVPVPDVAPNGAGCSYPYSNNVARLVAPHRKSEESDSNYSEHRSKRQDAESWPFETGDEIVRNGRREESRDDEDLHS